jgi:FixJ family two-component response regulator
MHTIFLVEDDPGVRYFVRMLLSAELPDCTVHEAATGRAFFALLEQQNPTLVLLDVQLPDASGLRLYGPMPSCAMCRCSLSRQIPTLFGERTLLGRMPALPSRLRPRS